MAEEEKTKAEQNAALSNLSTEGKADASTASGTIRAEDQAALNAAISNLSMREKKGSDVSGKEASTKKSSAATKAEDAKEEVKKIKISEEDIKFLVEQLELGKKQAEQLLRRHGGDRTTAIKDYILPKRLSSSEA